MTYLTAVVVRDKMNLIRLLSRNQGRDAGAEFSEGDERSSRGRVACDQGLFWAALLFTFKSRSLHVRA